MVHIIDINRSNKFCSSSHKSLKILQDKEAIKFDTASDFSSKPQWERQSAVLNFNTEALKFS